MSAWLLAIEGTETGHQVAMMLALAAAVLHAGLGAVQKGRHDPWLSRGAVDIWVSALAAPFALVIVPWPEPHMWPIFAGMVVIHLVYKLQQAQAYSKGAFTVVYPVVRGMGPFFTVIGAYLIFGETFAPMQWVGLGVLSAGIFGLALYNLMFLQTNRDTLHSALALAVLTGFSVAIYMTYDAYGIRATADPFTFLAWFFFLDGMTMPFVAWWRIRRQSAPLDTGPLLWRGLIGALFAFGSFGSILMATRLGKVGEAAVLRETSTVFAAFIGWLVLRETVGPRRIALIAMGAVIVELGG